MTACGPLAVRRRKWRNFGKIYGASMEEMSLCLGASVVEGKLNHRDTEARRHDFRR